MENIKNELDWIDRKILRHSVSKDLSIEELEEMLEKLYLQKEEFFCTSFMEVDIKDLEAVRFKLLESIYSIRIMVKEKQGKDASDEVERLMFLEMGGRIYEHRLY